MAHLEGRGEIHLAYLLADRFGNFLAAMARRCQATRAPRVARPMTAGPPRR